MGNLSVMHIVFFCRHRRCLMCQKSHCALLLKQRVCQCQELVVLSCSTDTCQKLRMTMLSLQVKQAFDFAYQQLIAPSDPSESLLEKIMRLDTVLVDRPRPKDPPAPEQLEQDMRDQMQHRSKRSRQHESQKDSRHSKDDHKGRKRRRERSLEFMDPDLNDEHEQRGQGAEGKEKRHKRRSEKHQKSDRHSSKRSRSPSTQHSQHIHFD